MAIRTALGLPAAADAPLDTGRWPPPPRPASHLASSPWDPDDPTDACDAPWEADGWYRHPTLAAISRPCPAPGEAPGRTSVPPTPTMHAWHLLRRAGGAPRALALVRRPTSSPWGAMAVVDTLWGGTPLRHMCGQHCPGLAVVRVPRAAEQDGTHGMQGIRRAAACRVEPHGVREDASEAPRDNLVPKLPARRNTSRKGVPPNAARRQQLRGWYAGHWGPDEAGRQCVAAQNTPQSSATDTHSSARRELARRFAPATQRPEVIVASHTHMTMMMRSTR